MSLAGGFGSLVRAEVLVNDGLPKHVAENFEHDGYQVLYSHAHDCDDRMVARTVAAHGIADTIVVATGDHMIVAAVTLLKAAGHKIVVVAIPQAVSDRLIDAADAFMELPVRYVNGSSPSISGRQSNSVETVAFGQEKRIA